MAIDQKSISATILTLNEEKNIERCICSLVGVADEIIVVDSFSSDKTREIASSFGAIIFERNWEGYSATKNYASSLAKHDYILSVDADESLSPELILAIQNVKKNGLNGIYEFNRLTNYCGQWIRHCGWYPDRKLRIFPKNSARWEGEFVHEKLVYDASLHKTFLKGDLLHYSYYTVEEHRIRSRKYAELRAKDIIARNESLLWLKILFSPLWKFFKMYVLQLGFLDGYYGWVISIISAREAMMKYWGGIRNPYLLNR